MAEPLGELEEEVPPLLTVSSGGESEGEAYRDARRNHSGSPPQLISESSGGESGSPLWQPTASGLRGGFLVGGTAAAAPAQQQQRPQQGQRRTLGSLDEIDQSDYGHSDEGEEDEDEWEPLYGGPGLAGVGGPAFPGVAAVLGALPGGAQLAGLGELELNEGLLQQVPIQDLLEAVLQGVGGGPLAGLLGAADGGGRGRSWGLSANGPRMFGAAALAVDASQIPAGLEGSARQHALNLAEQGFVTAMDPARHAACAAEGIPAGRQQGTSPLRRIPGAPAMAAPAAASRAGLQRADSAAAGGGLQRGDSAASQGLSRLERRQRAASSQQPAAALSRLASAPLGAEGASGSNGSGAPAGAGLTAAAGVAARAGDDDGPPGLAAEPSSESDSDFPPRMQATPALVQPGAPGSSSEGERGSAARRRSRGGTDAGRQPDEAPPLAGRRRRNAIFGQLPGLGAGTPLAGMGTPALPRSSDDERAAGGSATAGAPDAAHGARQPHELPEPDSDGHLLPPLEDASDGSDAGLGGTRCACRSRSAAALAPRRHRRLGGSSSSSSARSSISAPALEAGSDSEGSREGSRGAGDAGNGIAPHHAPGGESGSSDGSSSEGGSSRSSGAPPLRDSDGSAGATNADGGSLLRGHGPSELGSEPPSLASGEDSGSEGGSGRSGGAGSNSPSSLPPMLTSEDSSSEGEPPPRWAGRVRQLPGLISEGSSSSSADEAPSPLRPPAGREPARRFVLRGAPAPQQQPAHQAQGRQSFTADQQDVVQALTSLLPQQHDGAGWAELAAHVRSHRGSARRGGSGGGIQLLSRLVAAAARQFPGEAEAAGLTERPLAPPPVAAAAAPAGASAGASGVASRAASAGPGGFPGEAEAWPRLQQHAPHQRPQQQQQQQARLVTLDVGREGARHAPHGQLQPTHHHHQQQQQPQAAGQGAPSVTAAGSGAARAGGVSAQSPVPAGAAPQPDATAASNGVAALAALTASMRGAGSLQHSVASTEAALRLLSLPEAAASQHPLPPLVAAALAAARAPPPDQPEE